MDTAAERSANPLPGCWPARYQLLDGWRGLASFLVLLFHLELLGSGHEAVMLFFVISGYCIAAAADSDQRHQLTFGAFIARRLRRIYPPYFLSVMFFLTTRFAKSWMVGPSGLARFTTWEFLQNLTLTQWLVLTKHPRPNAADNGTLFVAAYWSLNYEEQFYLFMGLCLLFVSRRLGAWIIPAAVTLLLSVLWNWLFDSLRTGFFLDYWLHFSLGCLVFYRLVHGTSRAVRVSIDLTLCAVLLIGFSGLYSPFVSHELIVCSAFAGLLIFLRRWDADLSRITILRPLFWLGTISYSLYLVHQFNVRSAAYIGSIVGGDLAWLRLLATIGAHLGVATIFWYFCERPFLNRPLAQVRRDPELISQPATS